MVRCEAVTIAEGLVLGSTVIMSSQTRLVLASAALSSWMILLMTGFILGGITHLLLVLAPILFPWRDCAAIPDETGHQETAPTLDVEPR